MNRRGFTIVELLIVIVVIGLLATIVIVSYSGISQRAVAASLQSDLTNASKVLKNDLVSNNTLPNSLALANNGAGIKASQGNSYSYFLNNNANPPTFCLSATNGNTTYYITPDSTPSSGSCQTPGIMTSGLVLNLDAANAASYSGTGTSWLDLSGNNNTGSLLNGPLFNSLNSGGIAFDGINDMIQGVSNVPISNAFTISAWVKHNSVGSAIQRYITISPEIAVLRYSGLTGKLHFYLKTSGTLKHIEISNTISANQYYYVVGTWDGTTATLYCNKVSIGSSTPGGTLDTPSLYNLSSGTESLDGFIYNTSIYNRALSQSEITQNYNALRNRYGL